MSNRNRPTFLYFPRQIRLYFYTSSLEKLAQARYVFGRCGCKLDHYKGVSEPYDEDYTYGTEALLTKAVKQVRKEFGLRSPFFVEDTSLRLEALSKEKDFPGVTVKEWFADITFEKLDVELRTAGNNRRAVIKSDIALLLPTIDTPIFFHGETEGCVATTAPEFKKNVAYPWLTPENFNGWFIPNGETQRLGEVEPEKSLEIDFRSRALSQLLDRLYEYDAIAQMERSSFHMRQTYRLDQSELPLNLPVRPVLLVTGPRCAGKTTLGDYLRSEYGALHLEASHLIRDIASKKGVVVDDSEGAKKFLYEYGFDVVAREMVELIELQPTAPVVITGIRTVEELEFLAVHVPNLLVVNIQADLKTRYFRHIKRARDQAGQNMAEFQALDEEQNSFGLLRVIEDTSDRTITNDGTVLEAFLEKVRSLYLDFSKDMRVCERALDGKASDNSELIRCLLALEGLQAAATCDEIHRETSRVGLSVRTYNTNRALKEVPELATRLELEGQLLKYEITSHGKALLQALRALGRLKKGL